MKKSIIYLCLVFLPILLQGQTQIGVKSGYINYWFNTPDDYGHFRADYNYSHSAWLVAAVIRHKIPETHLNLALELEYSHRSFSVNSDYGELAGNQTFNYSYTIGNLYVHFEPQITFGSKFKFYFYPGIYWGMLANSKLSGTYSYWHMGDPPVSGTDTLSGSASGNYPDFEFGVYPGIGIEYPIYRNLDFLFEYKFIVNFSHVGSSWGSEETKVFNMNFEIGAVYTFKKSKKDPK